MSVEIKPFSERLGAVEYSIVWFLDKEHWLVVIGIIFAVLGAFYNAYGLDQKHKFFGGLTQGLWFGLVGGSIVGVAFGVISSFLILIVLVVTQSQNDQVGLTFSSGLIFIGAFSLIGVLLGIIFGFLVGLQLDTLQKSVTRSKKFITPTIIAFEMIFILSFLLQAFFLSFMQVKSPSLNFLTSDFWY